MTSIISDIKSSIDLTTISYTYLDALWRYGEFGLFYVGGYICWYAPWNITNIISIWRFVVAVTTVQITITGIIIRPQCSSRPLSLASISVHDKQRVLMHGHQGWNVRHGLCHIYMIYVYIWVVYSFCLFCCLFIIVTTQFVALYKPCKPKPSTYMYDPPPPPRTTTPWQRSKDRYLDRSQSNKYAINMQIQTISVSK